LIREPDPPGVSIVEKAAGILQLRHNGGLLSRAGDLAEDADAKTSQEM